MAASQNGWIANERDRVARLPIPGSDVALTVRKDAPGLLLLQVGAAVDRFVVDIDNARGALDDWGYAERPIRGGRTLSNHASGTAIDLNATTLPMGVDPDQLLTRAQIDRCHEIEAATGNVVRWGGDWSRPDAMHWEIAPGQSMADCERALDAMRQYVGTDFVSPAPPTTDGKRLLVHRPGARMMRGDDVRELQRVLNAWYPWLNLALDGVYGPKTAAAVRHLQARADITADGIVGPVTRGVLGL